MKVAYRKQLAKPAVARCIHGDDRLARVSSLLGDGAGQGSSFPFEAGLVDVARNLDHKLSVAVFKQEKAPLGVCQFDHGIDNGFEHARQPKLAVETLVDAKKPAQPTFEDRRSRSEILSALAIVLVQRDNFRVTIGLETGPVFGRRLHLYLPQTSSCDFHFGIRADVTQANEKLGGQAGQSPGCGKTPKISCLVGTSRQSVCQGKHLVPG